MKKNEKQQETMNVSKNKIQKWLTEKGFTRWAVYHGSNTDQYMDADGVNLWINWESGNFRMEWMIPHSIFRIVSGDMFPVWKLDHLERMYNRFLREVRAHEVGAL